MKSGRLIIPQLIALFLFTFESIEVLALGNSGKMPVLEEVIVTAEKREQNVQKVPSAISAFSAGMLKARGISKPQDLQFSVPGLIIGETSVGSVQVTMRGIGAENNGAGGDPGVPLHIDGHYIQFSNYILRDLFDVERVEVQRGPQGTLYGRNAVGGNINIVTKRPSDVFEGKISLDMGNYNKINFQGVVSGRLFNRLKGRLAVSDETRDGFVTNISNGDDSLLDSDYTSVRASLVYDLTDDLEIFFSGYEYNDKSTSFVTRVVGEYPRVGMFAGAPASYTNISASDPGKVRLNTPNSGFEDAEGVSMDVSWDLEAFTLKSLTAYNDAERGVLRDADGTDLPIRPQETNLLNQTVRSLGVVQGSQTLSQEFQLLSANDTNFKWVIGLFYFEESSDYNLHINIPLTPVMFRTPADVETNSFAAFGQVEYSLTNSLELTAGLRHTLDEKDMRRSILFTLDGVNNILDDNSELEDSWEETTGKLGLSYHIMEDILLYASYSAGFKAGGFNPTSVSEPSYDPELLDAYEVGMKGQFLDNRLQLNTSAFYYDYTDKVESTISILPGQTTGTVVFTNAAAATIIGIDLEMQAYVTDSLMIDASIGYQKSEYDEFISRDPQFDPPGVGQDLSGNQLTRAPEWKFHVGAQHAWQLGNNFGSLTARIDYSWVDAQFFRAFNLDTDKANSYHRTNAKLWWESNGADWQAELYVLNIEDDYVLSNLIVTSPDFGFAHGGSYLSPRTYGLNITYNF